ncbi:MAG: type II toxin-antitoxin system VapC family toxin [Isosphaeraceae bacterium]
MIRFLFDTDHLTLFQHGHPPLGVRLSTVPAGSVGVSIVTVEESIRGRLAQLSRASDGPTRIRRYAMLGETIQLFASIPVIPYDTEAESRFDAIRKLRIGSQDLRIAAIALANQLTLVTRNRRDFSRIPGLTIDDWSD